MPGANVGADGRSKSSLEIDPTERVRLHQRERTELSRSSNARLRLSASGAIGDPEEDSRLCGRFVHEACGVETMPHGLEAGESGNWTRTV